MGGCKVRKLLVISLLYFSVNVYAAETYVCEILKSFTANSTYEYNHEKHLTGKVKVLRIDGKKIELAQKSKFDETKMFVEEYERITDRPFDGIVGLVLDDSFMKVLQFDPKTLELSWTFHFNANRAGQQFYKCQKFQ